MPSPKNQEIVIEPDSISQIEDGVRIIQVHRTAIRNIELARADRTPLPRPLQIIGGFSLIAIGILSVPYILWQWPEDRIGLSFGRFLLVLFACILVGGMMIYDAFRRKYVMLIVTTRDPNPIAAHGMKTPSALKYMMKRIELEYGFKLK